MGQIELLLNTERAEICTCKDFINNDRPRAEKAKDTLCSGNGAGNDFLGWIDYPETTAPADLTSIATEVAQLREKCQALVVAGIGGSYLGARAVIEALSPAFGTHKGYPSIIYAGNTLSEYYYTSLLQKLQNIDYGVVVISKSGTTTETAIAFRLLKEDLEKRYGRKEAATRIIAITDARRGALHDLAKQEEYHTYIIPDNVGGRFSVLTPVGTLPIAMAGIDTKDLIAGAQRMRRCCIESPFEENPALQYAAVRNYLYENGYCVETLAMFEPSLQYIAEWWKQLYGESEGKEHKGLLPYSLCYTTDLHSMGQYVQDGSRLMFETFLHVRECKDSLVMHKDPDGKNLDGLDYLQGKGLSTINHCAEAGTVAAHKAGGTPIIEVSIPTINAESIGELLYFFEFACGVSGYMLGVNPFNQPGVEQYKRNMFELLGKPGYTK